MNFIKLIQSKAIADFENSFDLLDQLKAKLAQSFDTLKLILFISKKNHVPFIGNPLITLQNHLIELEYALNLHILNCEIYKELITDGVELDDLFVEQLAGLLETSEDILAQYESLKEQLNKTSNYNGTLKITFA